MERKRNSCKIKTSGKDPNAFHHLAVIIFFLSHNFLLSSSTRGSEYEHQHAARTKTRERSLYLAPWGSGLFCMGGGRPPSVIARLARLITQSSE